MKKTIFFFALVSGILMFASCSSHYDEIDDVVDQSVILTKSANGTSTSIDVIYDVDLKLLKKYLRLSGKDKKQHSIQPLQLDGITLAYCIQYVDGWEIISADQRCAPVMMISDTGICNIDDFDIKGLLNHIADVRNSNSENIISTWKIISTNCNSVDLSPITKAGGSPESFAIGMWRAIDTVLVDEVIETPHIIQANWAQDTPWNDCMRYIGVNEHALVGSFTVAAGQIIHHYRKVNSHGVEFPTGAYPGVDSTDFSTDLNYNMKDSLRWSSMPLDTNGANTRYVAIMLAYLEQDVMRFGSYLNNYPTYIDSISSPFRWGALSYNQRDGYNFDDIYYSLINGSPVCVYAYAITSNARTTHAYIIDRYRKTDTYYAITCRWDPDYVVSEEEYYANDPEMFIESASGDEKVFTKGLITYTYWGMNWGLSETVTNFNNRFYMSRSYNAGGYDEAGYIPSSDYINSPYWDMSLGRTSSVIRMYSDFRSW